MHEIKIGDNILKENVKIAEENRDIFYKNNIYAVNIMGSPGSGKTSLLEKTLSHPSKYKFCVIEGDMKTSLDAERIKKFGIDAHQINTGKECHLDAHMIHSVIHNLDVSKIDILVIENVGNLVCPAEFDLGENDNIMVYSVTEGDDKPEKYPFMFRRVNLILLNKIDLSEYVDFDEQKALDRIKRINPNVKIIRISCRTGEGILDWLNWLRERVEMGIVKSFITSGVTI